MTEAPPPTTLSRLTLRLVKRLFYQLFSFLFDYFHYHPENFIFLYNEQHCLTNQLLLELIFLHKFL